MKNASLIGAFSLLCLLLFGIPFGLIRVFSQRALDDRDQVAIEQSSADLGNILARSKLDTLKTGELGTYFQGIAEQTVKGPDVLRSLPPLKAMLQRRFPGLLSFIVLDGNGDPIASLSDLQIPAGLGPKMMKDLRETALGNPAGLTAHIGEYRRFFGPALARRIRLNFGDGFERLDYRGEFRFGYFSSAFKNGMMILLIRDSANWDLLMALHRIREMNSRWPGTRAALVDLRHPMGRWKRLFGRSWKDLRTVLLQPRILDGAPVEAGGKLWSMRSIRGPWRLIVSYPIDWNPQVKTIRQIVDGCCCLGFIICSGLAWYLVLGNGRSWLSIRVKLVALLIYVVAVPLMLLGGTARDFLRERRALLLQEERSRHERILQEFDRGFLIGLGQTVSKIRAALEHPLPAGGDLTVVTRERLTRIAKRYAIDLGELVDERGKSCYHFKGKNESSYKPLIMAIQDATSNILGDLNRGSGAMRRESARAQLISATAEMFGFNVEKIVGLIAQKLGHLERIFMARATALVTLQPVGLKGQPAKFLAMLGWDDANLQPLYVRNRLPFLCRRLPTDTVLSEAVSDGESRSKRKSYPEIREKLRRRLDDGVVPASLEFTDGKEQLLMTGMRGINLPKFRFYIVTDDKAVQAQLKKLMVPYLALSLTLLAVALAVAGILSARFLAPVGNLMRGIAAMRGRRFDQQIPVIQRDELGQLSVAFNDMMEGMKELEVAKIVQDSLFPSQPLIAGSWGICGTCQAASRVGGDYFDYFALPDGRLVFLIGDVSGHGTSAALVVAMAKALITHPDTVHEPGPILDLMQGVFFTTLQRKKMMSCFCAVFDPASGVLRAANAGHNMPYLIRAGGTVEQLKAGGKPLGTKNKPFVTQEYQLAAGDWLFLYTDGFIEAQATDGRDIGYDRVEAMLPGLRGADAVETQHRLREWQTVLSAPGPQADDITVVVLQNVCVRAGASD